MLVCLSFGGPKTERSERRSNECWVRKDDPFLQSTTCVCICAAQKPIGHPWGQGTGLPMPSWPPEPRVPESCFPARTAPQPELLQRGFLPWWHFSWINTAPNTLLKWITETTSKRRNWRSYSNCLPNKTTHFQPEQGQRSRKEQLLCLSECHWLCCSHSSTCPRMRINHHPYSCWPRKPKMGTDSDSEAWLRISNEVAVAVSMSKVQWAAQGKSNHLVSP